MSEGEARQIARDFSSSKRSSFSTSSDDEQAATCVLSLQCFEGVSAEDFVARMSEFGTIKHAVMTPSLSSAMVIYAEVEQAERALNALMSSPDGLGRLWGTNPRFHVRYGRKPRMSDEELARMLLVPAHGTVYLISPPPSPPDTWIPRLEDGPNRDQAPDLPPPVLLADEAKMLLLPETEATPRIVVDACLFADEETATKAPVRVDFQRTRRPDS